MRFVLMFGPPAVGKMTVGRHLARLANMRLFHNHAVLEPLLDVFDYGTPPFNALLNEFRQRVIEEAAASRTDLIFTCVWGLDLQSDADLFGGYLQYYAERRAQVFVVELAADLETRLARNRTEQRLLDKPSKRDVEWSENNVRSLETYRMNTRPDDPHDAFGEAVLARYPHLRLDTNTLSAETTATAIHQWMATEQERAASETVGEERFGDRP